MQGPQIKCRSEVHDHASALSRCRIILICWDRPPMLWMLVHGLMPVHMKYRDTAHEDLEFRAANVIMQI